LSTFPFENTTAIIKMATPFDKVLTLNHAFGTIEHPSPQKAADPDDITKAHKLVVEEVNELLTAQTRIDIADGVADVLVVADGMLARMGYDANSTENILRDLRGHLDALGTLPSADNIDLLLKIKATALLISHTLGINSMEAFNIVHENNMSKLCPTEEDADATIQQYIEQGRLTKKYRAGEFWVVREGGPKDKFLKNHKWSPPDLSSL